MNGLEAVSQHCTAKHRRKRNAQPGGRCQATLMFAHGSFSLPIQVVSATLATSLNLEAR